MKTAKDRLIQFIDSQNVTKDDFARKNSLANSTFSNQSDITTAKLLNIFKNYPELNMDWVVTGRGKMILGVESESENVLNEPGRNYGVEDWREKYYALLEKYNRCLEVQNAVKTQAS